MKPFDPSAYRRILFFTGAGMSAESGVPTYRGKGGIWKEYDFEEFACQCAFERTPEKVLRFHELRRRSVLDCHPHDGHRVIASIPGAVVVTQNIDGMHQRAGSGEVIELHGSLWRLRCKQCRTITEDMGKEYQSLRCTSCGNWLRPDITWFGDMLDETVMQKAAEAISSCDLFISIGTSGTVWPAAGFPDLARKAGAFCIEINPEPSGSTRYNLVIRESAGSTLPRLFGTIDTAE
ncbi:MAG: NAD-dependent deacylase [Chlorobiaceae bacterium]|nr:NAD-dependent deacylase [Chlorobiaceae bacterium]